MVHRPQSADPVSGSSDLVPKRFMHRVVYLDAMPSTSEQLPASIDRTEIIGDARAHIVLPAFCSRQQMIWYLAPAARICEAR